MSRPFIRATRAQASKLLALQIKSHSTENCNRNIAKRESVKLKPDIMLSHFHKLMTFASIFPLMIAFLGKDCAHQKRNIKGQTSEAINKMDNAQIGLWGGEHISLDVTPQGATVEYDCGHGSIDQKIIPDGQGHFNVNGTHVREHGGPIRKNETSNSHPASFRGQIKNNTMTLTVTESDTQESVGTFTLVYGQKPHIVKCR